MSNSDAADVVNSGVGISVDVSRVTRPDGLYTQVDRQRMVIGDDIDASGLATVTKLGKGLLAAELPLERSLLEALLVAVGDLRQAVVDLRERAPETATVGRLNVWTPGTATSAGVPFPYNESRVLATVVNTDPTATLYVGAPQLLDASTIAGVISSMVPLAQGTGSSMTIPSKGAFTLFANGTTCAFLVFEVLR